MYSLAAPDIFNVNVVWRGEIFIISVRLTCKSYQTILIVNGLNREIRNGVNILGVFCFAISIGEQQQQKKKILICRIRRVYVIHALCAIIDLLLLCAEEERERERDRLLSVLCVCVLLSTTPAELVCFHHLRACVTRAVLEWRPAFILFFLSASVFSG